MDENLNAQAVLVMLETGVENRQIDRQCAEILGWRVSRDEWWNWHPGPVYDPPGDEWCIRRDGRNDVPCNEALPRFTAETFRKALGGSDA